MKKIIEYDYERLDEDGDIQLLKRDKDHENCDILVATIMVHAP